MLTAKCWAHKLSLISFTVSISYMWKLNLRKFALGHIATNKIIKVRFEFRCICPKLSPLEDNS
jgi:hypothetical protein